MPEQDSITEAHELAVRGAHRRARVRVRHAGGRRPHHGGHGARRHGGGRAARRLAAEETGYGRAAHKTFKNVFNTQWVYEGFKDERTVGVIANDTRSA